MRLSSERAILSPMTAVRALDPVYPAGVDDRIGIAGRSDLAAARRVVVVDCGVIDEAPDRDDLPPGNTAPRAATAARTR